MTPEPWPTLVTRWRDMADTVAQFGADAAAAALRLAAGELEVAHRAHQGEPLPLAQAAAESGLSAGHLGRMVRQGTLPNAGAPGRPRIARAHLPRRGPAPPPGRAGPDRGASIVLFDGKMMARGYANQTTSASEEPPR